MMKEEEYFSENLAPTRLLSCRKKQKIHPENWYLYNSYDERKSRKFLGKFGTYATPKLQEEAEDLSGKLAPTRLLLRRKTQKISPEILHLNASYAERTCRKLLQKVGTYTMPYIKIYQTTNLGC